MNETSRVDLHVHSTASDGALSPRALVDAAETLELSALAISDHDTVDGLPEALETAAGKRLHLIPAVELSINLTAGGSAHLLGYFPVTDPVLLYDRGGNLGRALAHVRAARETRNPRIIEKLAQLGFPLFEEEVLERAGGDVVGRPHIAQAMLSRGYVQSTREAFDRFLARGKPAYVERERLWESSALGVIRELGGLPVLAHPGLLERSHEQLSSLIRSLVTKGLSGVEVYYPRHSPEMVRILEAEIRSQNLLATGGTDFHGSPDDPAGLGGTKGVFVVKAAQVAGFLKRCVKTDREGTDGETERADRKDR